MLLRVMRLTALGGHAVWAHNEARCEGCRAGGSVNCSRAYKS